MASFWLVGFKVISDPFSIEMLFLSGMFILIPTLIAGCVSVVMSKIALEGEQSEASDHIPR